MNNSTQGVTLFAVFLNDVLKNYEDQKDLYKDLFDMTKGYDLSDPFNKVPMQLYNDCCAWIEKELGKFNLIRVGKNIGETVWSTLQANNMIQAEANPLEIMQALKIAADNMIQDPEGRGWNILEPTSNSLVMQRTQTFNSKLQFGLLQGLVSKSPGITDVEVTYRKNIDEGDAFDEYLVKWANL
jgi:hypothetical protein